MLAEHSRLAFDTATGSPAAPLVTVVTIFLDCERFLEEAVQSVLGQTYANWELILVDDGSSDGSTAIARRYANSYPDKIRYIEHENHVNRGMSASRNAGFRVARGKYIALLDADDVWLPQNLERKVAILEAAPDVGMLYAPSEFWFSWTGRPEDADADRVLSLDVEFGKVFEPPELLVRVYPLGPAEAPCPVSLLCRTDMVRRLGGFEDAFTGFYEDQAFLTKVYASERVIVSDGCYSRYRQHPGSCCEQVRLTGRYHSFRVMFLRWLRDYLRARGIKDEAVWGALNRAFGSYVTAMGRSSTDRLFFRVLRLGDRGDGRLEYPADNPDSVRIVIKDADPSAPWDVQLNVPQLQFKGGSRYTLSFRARADAPRTINVGCADASAPWSNLGLYEYISLSTEWQLIERTFIAERDQPDARIHFDVGQSDVPVEVSDITLRCIDTGHFLWSVSPSAPGRAPAVTDENDPRPLNADSWPDMSAAVTPAGASRASVAR